MTKAILLVSTGGVATFFGQQQLPDRWHRSGGFWMHWVGVGRLLALVLQLTVLPGQENKDKRLFKAGMPLQRRCVFNISDKSCQRHQSDDGQFDNTVS